MGHVDRSEPVRDRDRAVGCAQVFESVEQFECAGGAVGLGATSTGRTVSVSTACRMRPVSGRAVPLGAIGEVGPQSAPIGRGATVSRLRSRQIGRERQRL
jgi:hypothetical protein